MARPLKRAKGRVLVSAPGLTDPNFMQTIVYVCQHSADGAYGFIVNRPRAATLRMVSTGPHTRGPLGDAMVLEGGPVKADRLGMLAVIPKDRAPGFSVRLLTAEQSLRQLECAPETRLFAVAGHAGWSAGQLDEELAEGSWVIRKPGPEVWDMRLTPGLWPFYYDNDLSWRPLLPFLPRLGFAN